MRDLPRCLVAGSAAMLTAAALNPAGVARAGSSDIQLKTAFGQTTIAPRTQGDVLFLYGHFVHADPAPRALHVTYTVDFSAVSAFARVQFAGFVDTALGEPGAAPSTAAAPCHTSAAVISCAITATSAEPFVDLGLYKVSPRSSAIPGQSGAVRVSARVVGGTTTTSTGQVRIGQPVDLAAGSGSKLSAGAGVTKSAGLRVRNAGSTAVTGAVLILSVAPGLLTGPRYRNCRYGTVIRCTFGTVLQPGTSYAVSRPLSLRVPRGVPVGSRAEAIAQWLTPATWEDWLATFTDLTIGPAGTGPALSLAPLADAAGVPQADVNPANDASVISLRVTGAQRPDIAAIGAQLLGKVGDEVTVRVGFANNGPGTLRPDLFDNNFVASGVTLPKNLIVVRADPRCLRLDVRHYECWSTRKPLPSGSRLLFTFTLKFAKGPGGGGSVETSGAGIDALLGRNPVNDTAKISVAETGAGLPITGTGAGLIAVLLLATGTAGVLLARRRRTHLSA